MTGAVNGTASYHLDDDTLRWANDTRLGPVEYAEAKCLGFKLWRGSGVWVAKWTPEREDWLLQHVEGIEHETDPDDPTGRIVRFASRAVAANERREAALAHLPPGGQPIQPPGHHSRKAHLRLLERSDQHMRKAVEERSKADYWRRRAEGSERRARQKSDPLVVAARIDRLEADLRRMTRNRDSQQAGSAAHWQRWIDHLELRVAFERARLESLKAQPFAAPEAFKPGDIVRAARYGRCEVVRVGPKNVRVKILDGGARGMQFLVLPHELTPWSEVKAD